MQVTRRIFNKIVAGLMVSTKTLTAQATDTVPPVIEAKKHMIYGTVDIRDVIIKKEFCMRKIEQEHVDALKKSISAIGLLSPITVTMLDKKPLLIAGFIRALAILDLPMVGISKGGMDYRQLRKEVPCMIYTPKDMDKIMHELRLSNITESYVRKEITKEEKCKVIYKLINVHGETKERIAKILNLSPTTVGRYYKIGEELYGVN